MTGLDKQAKLRRDGIHATIQIAHAARRAGGEAHAAEILVLGGMGIGVLEGGTGRRRERIVAGDGKLMGLAVGLQGHRQLQHVLQAGPAAGDDVVSHSREQRPHQVPLPPYRLFGTIGLMLPLELV